MPRKLFFPIFSIYPFKNTHTVPNTVLQQNMQQWIIMYLEHIFHNCNFTIYSFSSGEYIRYAISHNNSLYIQEDPLRIFPMK